VSLEPVETAPAPDASLPAAPADPPAWHALLAFALIVVGVVALQVALMAAVVAIHHRRLSPLFDDPARFSAALLSIAGHGPWLLLTLGLTQVALIGGALFAADLTGPSLRARLRLDPSRLGAAGYALAALGMLTVGQALDGLASHVQVHSATLSMLGDATQEPLNVFVPLVVIGALGPAFGEEFVFRGYMGSVLAARWRPVWNVLTTSIAFGLIHFDVVHSPLAFGMGLFLGYVAERAQSIRPTMVAHAINNGVAFIAGRLDPSGESTPMSWPLIAAMVALSVAAIVLLQRLRRAEPG
jgi:membrane protease YdiL (CAAX protease family)